MNNVYNEDILNHIKYFKLREYVINHMQMFGYYRHATMNKC